MIFTQGTVKTFQFSPIITGSGHEYLLQARFFKHHIKNGHEKMREAACPPEQTTA
jgi:hypothetical protein